MLAVRKPKPILHQHWKFLHSETFGNSEKETWMCKGPCGQLIMVSSYKGKRDTIRLYKPCECTGSQ